MTPRRRYGLIPILLAATPVVGASPGPAEPPLSPARAEIGRPAPDFVLTDLDGGSHRLTERRGRIVVLEWTNHECPAVNHLYDTGTIAGARATVENEPVEWLLVDSSHFCTRRAAEIRRWRDRREIHHPYLLDAEGTVGRLYDASRTPQVFVIDAQGVLAYVGAVADRHGEVNYLAGALKALLHGSDVTPTYVRPRGCSVKYATSPPGTETQRSYAAAAAHARSGDFAAALDDLRRSLAAGHARPSDVLVDSAFDALRADDRARVRLRELLGSHAVESSITLVAAGEPGEPMIVSGVVRTREGDAVPGALVYVYHTDARGIYSARGDGDPRLFGYLRTGPDGEFELKTIRPASYPGMNVDQHMHFVITAAGHQDKRTRLGFSDDPYWQRRTPGTWVAKVTIGDDGVARCRHDLVIDR